MNPNKINGDTELISFQHINSAIDSLIGEWNMKVLVLGGTGAMGKPLVQYLSNNGAEVLVTTRINRTHENENVKYIVGNAHDLSFIMKVLSRDHFDAIIDFMVYTIDELKNRVDTLLSSTDQYIFLSSARVYADSGKTRISERTPRLVDVVTDNEYLSTEEYAIVKSKAEDLLLNNIKNNFTIVRPYITYNDERLQLGVFEKEVWLKRALQGKKIVFSRDIANKYTTMTYGEDVARCITRIIGNNELFGKTINIVSNISISWDEVLNLYLSELEEHLGYKPEVAYVKKYSDITDKSNYYQACYDRLYDRIFDNQHIVSIIGSNAFIDPHIGLRRCLKNCLNDNIEFKSINWKREALLDRVSKDKSFLKDIKGIKNKIRYFTIRYLPKFIWKNKICH